MNHDEPSWWWWCTLVVVHTVVVHTVVVVVHTVVVVVHTVVVHTAVRSLLCPQRCPIARSVVQSRCAEQRLLCSAATAGRPVNSQMRCSWYAIPKRPKAPELDEEGNEIEAEEVGLQLQSLLRSLPQL